LSECPWALLCRQLAGSVPRAERTRGSGSGSSSLLADLIGYVVYKYFGMRAYGTIYGSQYTAFLIGIAFGPLFAGAVFDRYHAYTFALVGAGAALTIAAALMTRLGPFPSLANGIAEAAPLPVAAH
jgi:MFS family permease